ncbi:MAG: SCO family protein [Pseudomonadota bacterium]
MIKRTSHRHQRGRIFLVILVAVVATAGGLIAANRWMQSTAEYQALQTFPAPRMVADFALETAAGEPFSMSDLDGRWNLLFFGFTNCPDVCPDTLAMLDQSMQQLTLMRREELPQVVFVSVDPQRDNGEALADYVSWFNDDFIGVTGPEPQLIALTRQLGVAYFREEADEETGFYNVDHSAAVILVNPEGQLYGRFAHPLDPALVTADLFQLTGS